MGHLRTSRLRRSAVIACALLVAAVGLVSLCASGHLCGQPGFPVIGVVNLTPALDPVLDGFKAGMSELGYIEGKNVTYLYEGATGSIEALAPALKAAVGRKVDLIFAISTPAAMQARRAVEGTSIPVVFAPVFDPVESGIVRSLRHPGGNLTGIRVGGFIPKQLEWLLSVAPKARRILVLHNPEDRSSVLGLKMLRSAAERAKVDIVLREVRTLQEIDQTIADIPETADAIIHLPDNLVLARSAEICRAATDRGLPVAAVSVAGAAEYAVVAFGTRFFSVGEQAARLGEQILKGVSVKNLPVETAEFFLTVNLEQAKAIGLDVPDHVLRHADTIIR